jgi:hypothetical protein
MPLPQFTTYDIIVDTLPGFLLLALLIPIFPESVIEPISKSPVFSGIVILFLGYIVGRLVHTTSPDLDDMNILKKSDADDDMAVQVVGELASKMKPLASSSSPKEQKLSKLGLVHDNLSGVISYGQTLLYGENTLYMKYEMLYTFFRSIYWSLAVVIGLYAVRGIVGLIAAEKSITIPNVTPVWMWQYYVLALFPWALAWLISRRGMRTFDQRRANAYIYDLHTLLELEDEPPSDILD